MDNKELESKFNELHYNHNLIVDKLMKCQEDLIKQVLRTVLGREPEIEDYKRCTLYRQEGDFTGHFLAYDKMKLGRIQERLDATSGIICGYSFTPDKNAFERSEIDGKVTW